MTTEDTVRKILAAAGEQRQPSPVPVGELIRAGRRARRKRRSELLTGMAAAAVLIILLGGVALKSGIGHWAQPAGQPADHGSLSDHEFAVAVDIARQQADKTAISITSATATVGIGTVAESNTGHPCTSGTLLHIKLIGEFNIQHGGSPDDSGHYDPVSAVLITADPDSGDACLITVQTGDVAPDPGATILFT